MPIIAAIFFGPGYFMSFEEADIFVNKFKVILKIIYQLYNILPALTIIAIIGVAFVIILKKAKKETSLVWPALAKVFCLNLIYSIPVNILTGFAGGLPEAANHAYLTDTHLKLVYILIYILNILLAIFINKHKEKKTLEEKAS